MPRALKISSGHAGFAAWMPAVKARHIASEDRVGDGVAMNEQSLRWETMHWNVCAQSSP